MTPYPPDSSTTAISKLQLLPSVVEEGVRDALDVLVHPVLLHELGSGLRFM